MNDPEPEEMEALLNASASRCEPTPLDENLQEEVWAFASGRLDASAAERVAEKIRANPAAMEELAWADAALEDRGFEDAKIDERVANMLAGGTRVDANIRPMGSRLSWRQLGALAASLIALAFLAQLFLAARDSPFESFSIDKISDQAWTFRSGEGEEAAARLTSVRLNLELESPGYVLLLLVSRDESGLGVTRLFPPLDALRAQDPRYAAWPTNPLPSAVKLAIPPEEQSELTRLISSDDFHLLRLYSESPRSERDFSTAIDAVQKQLDQLDHALRALEAARSALEGQWDAVERSTW